MSFLLTSGELNGQLGVEHEVQSGLEREHRLRTLHWILQLQKNQRNSSNMSNRMLMSFLLTSGEYIRIHLILWIISIKEKEVAILQWWIQPHKMETFIRLTARAQNTQLATNIYHDSTKTTTAFDQSMQTTFNVGGVDKHAAQKNNGAPSYQSRKTWSCPPKPLKIINKRVPYSQSRKTLRQTWNNRTNKRVPSVSYTHLTLPTKA